MNDFAINTTFTDLAYEFRSGTRVTLSGEVEVECGRIPDTIEIDVRDAVEPKVVYRARVSTGHPLHRHVRLHVAGVDI
jgi:hypothetical protein